MPAMMQRSVVILGEDASHDAFTAWYQGMQAALMDCGYVARKEHFTPAYSCAPLEEWGRRYSGWILDPLVNSIHAARHLFDLRPAIGDRSLWDRLVTELRAAARQDAGFVRLLANDCLSALPPLTFFRDAVIDESGESSKVFDIERTALRPLADVGRVFGIAAGRLLGASTQERFRLARALLPEQESIFREASETLRVVLTQQARTGIRQQSNGAQLSPELLSQYDRQVLKSGFRSIHTLLEFTAEGTWLDKKV
jgi:CBS domain-containing protein